MKGDTIFFLLIGLVLATLTSATPEITFQHNEIQPGETIFATITTTGEFAEEITESDITFLEGRKNVFFEFDLTYFNYTYYFYTYTTREGNFTLKISDILYKENETLQSTTITKNFLIQKEPIVEENTSRTEILSIKPGFIKPSNDLEITFMNKGNSSFNITCPNKEISLKPLQSEKIIFEQDSFFELFSCSTYKEFLIPVMRTSDYIIIPPIFQDLKISPESISRNLTIGESPTEKIQFFNFGDDNFTDFEIVSDFDFIEIETFKSLLGKEVQELSLTISPKFPGHFKGKINITYIHNEETKTIFFPIDFFVLPAGSSITDFQLSNLSCAELNGNICDSGTQICNGTAKFTDLGQYCCQGGCIAKTSHEDNGMGYGWLIGILIFILLGGGGYYLYKRQKKVAPQKPEEQMKQTSEKLEERLKGKTEPERTSGRLQRT